MQIFLQKGSANGEEGGRIPEWGLIEVQGSFESREEHDTVHGQYLADLNYTNDGVPFLIIGHHILYGEQIKLNKPMALMRRASGSASDTQQKEYLVDAVIRRKIIFKSRPKPIIPESQLTIKH